MKNSLPQKRTENTFAKGDRVTWITNRGLVDATGTLVSEVYTDGDGIEVAQVQADPNPFVLSSIPHTIDVADLKLIRGAR